MEATNETITFSKAEINFTAHLFSQANVPLLAEGAEATCVRAKYILQKMSKLIDPSEVDEVSDAEPETSE